MNDKEKLAELAQWAIKEEMNISLKVNPNVECDFSDMNRECLFEKCDFYIN